MKPLSKAEKKYFWWRPEYAKNRQGQSRQFRAYCKRFMRRMRRKFLKSEAQEVSE